MSSVLPMNGHEFKGAKQSGWSFGIAVVQVSEVRNALLSKPSDSLGAVAIIRSNGQ
jgi:hypothetical protein